MRCSKKNLCCAFVASSSYVWLSTYLPVPFEVLIAALVALDHFVKIVWKLICWWVVCLWCELLEYAEHEEPVRLRDCWRGMLLKTLWNLMSDFNRSVLDDLLLLLTCERDLKRNFGRIFRSFLVHSSFKCSCCYIESESLSSDLRRFSCTRFFCIEEWIFSRFKCESMRIASVELSTESPHGENFWV